MLPPMTTMPLYYPTVATPPLVPHGFAYAPHSMIAMSMGGIIVPPGPVVNLAGTGTSQPVSGGFGFVSDSEKSAESDPFSFVKIQ